MVENIMEKDMTKKGNVIYELKKGNGKIIEYFIGFENVLGKIFKFKSIIKFEDDTWMEKEME